jgi:hypothetical protein
MSSGMSINVLPLALAALREQARHDHYAMQVLERFEAGDLDTTAFMTLADVVAALVRPVFGYSALFWAVEQLEAGAAARLLRTG